MPFISKLNAVAATSALLNPDAATSLKQVVFTIAPKPNSHTRPVTAAYTLPYLLSRGYVRGNTLTVPVFGLYAGYDNTVGLTYTFTDGSITNESLTITTEPWADPAGYNKKQIVQSRAQGTNLSYDFFLVKGYGGGFSPTLLDTSNFPHDRRRSPRHHEQTHDPVAEGVEVQRVNSRRAEHSFQA